MYRILMIANVLFFVIVLIINTLAVTSPFWGKSIVELTDLHANMLTPEHFSSSIWSIIYPLLSLSIIDQIKTVLKKEAVPREVQSVGIGFIITFVLNCGWLIAWEAEYLILSFAIIFSNWLTLIWVYYRLVGVEKARWIYTIPFSIYLAWICIGALLHLNLLLIYLGFDFFGLSEEYWTAALIVMGIFGTLLVLYLNQDIWFTLVLIWAFLGIFLRSKRLFYENNWVTIMSLFAMVFLAVVGTWTQFRKIKSSN